MSQKECRNYAASGVSQTPIYGTIIKGAKNIGQVICVPDDFFGNDEQCEGGYNGYNALIFVYGL